MKYRHSDYDFSLEVVPIGTGALARILKYCRTDIGNLFEFIAPILYRTPKFRSSKYWFTLVNVTCSHNGFSYGLAPSPPKEVRPLSCTWLFTFALSGAGYGEVEEIKHASMRGINVFAWGRLSSQFLTIGVTHMQARDFGLRHDQFTPMYAYYLVGALTKSFALRNKYFTPQPDYQRMYEQANLSTVHSQYGMMPLYQLMRNMPYHVWVFNKNIWTSASRLISVKHITAETLLYLCKYLSNVAQLSDKVELEVLDQFHESLTDMIQRRGDSAEELVPATETWQLLYAALMNRGNIPEADTLNWLINADKQLTVPYGDLNAHIYKLIYA